MSDRSKPPSIDEVANFWAAAFERRALHPTLFLGPALVAAHVAQLRAELEPELMQTPDDDDRGSSHEP